uniref:DOT1 domain-containing protein n=1 Tax=Globodera pallida TaxID=36090 RepID=A0A183CSU1_GLOPA
AEASLLDVTSSESLRCGDSAYLLFVSALAERGLVDKNIDTGGISMLVERLCQHILIDCACLTLERGISTLDVASGAAGIALAFHKLHRLCGYDIFQSVASKTRYRAFDALLAAQPAGRARRAALVIVTSLKVIIPLACFGLLDWHLKQVATCQIAK